MEYSHSGAQWPGRKRIQTWLQDATRWLQTKFTWGPVGSNEPSGQWKGLSDSVSVGYTYTVLMINGQPEQPGSRPPSRAPSQGPSDASWMDVSLLAPAQVTQAADRLFRQDPWAAAQGATNATFARIQGGDEATPQGNLPAEEQRHLQGWTHQRPGW